MSENKIDYDDFVAKLEGRKPIAPSVTEKERAIIKLGRNRRLAHKVIFSHKHAQRTPDFHYDIMDLWNDERRFAGVIAFRGAAKSTLAEEATTLKLLYREFTNGIILGETWTRAVEHLQKVRVELETNPYILEMFGSLIGEKWSDDKLVLSTGLVVHALGRGQSLRGTKHIDARPDFAFLDDIEDKESCQSEATIEKTMQWLVSEVMPAMAPGYRMRINGTPLHPNAVLMQLSRDEEWKFLRVPIEYLDDMGERQAAWPERFPLEDIDRTKNFYYAHGQSNIYQQEYMCKAEDTKEKPFNKSMFVIDTVARSWQGVYVMYDPARTTNKTSAFTGKAVWSWIGNKLVVWECTAHMWKPDELVDDMFRTAAQFTPVMIYVEEDGLNEWLMQPIRQKQLERGAFFPVKPVKAPKGKIDFILGMQPFFKAHEIVFANTRMPDLEQQLLNFPTGKIDAPNALAYALRLRSGAPVYNGFGVGNILDELPLMPGAVPILAINTIGAHTSGILLQVRSGGVNVISDWVDEGDPSEVLPSIVADARVAANGRPLKVIVPPAQFTRNDRTNLLPTARKLSLDPGAGGPPSNGRVELAELLKRTIKGRPALLVSSAATWTLRAFSGGFYYQMGKDGRLSDEPAINNYRGLIESLESVAALLAGAALGGEEKFYETDPNTGRRYLTSRGGVSDAPAPSKADWGVLVNPKPRRY